MSLSLSLVLSLVLLFSCRIYFDVCFVYINIFSIFFSCYVCNVLSYASCCHMHHQPPPSSTRHTHCTQGRQKNGSPWTTPDKENAHQTRRRRRRRRGGGGRGCEEDPWCIFLQSGQREAIGAQYNSKDVVLWVFFHLLSHLCEPLLSAEEALVEISRRRWLPVDTKALGGDTHLRCHTVRERDTTGS